MIRILLAEDQAMVRQGLKMMIETDPEMKVTGEARNGREAVQLCETHRFDIAVMDIRMPEMDGLEATGIIRSRWPSCKVLILTTFNDDDYALEALKRGASGYMLKDADPAQLTRSIRSALSGGVSLEDQVAAKVLPRLLRTGEPKLAEPDPSLTPRERDIARLVGEGCSNQEIAERLSLSVGTVKNHISQVLDKLELRDRTQLAIYAIRHDLV
ncbi:DNA-binding response regulator [Paenibacillus cisolokensis]|jgi:Response regulator containing a CheY-like receiver domain and an HTH DNA-binding domain|uniref:DNA-binding response regulator n=1 Tax=Paenibacillus cisolokensis TaxID=1658519 RepID=A0ABQ4NF51_9BACL|nr:response regulator transcription factor [Paenibacillus cisolokensis]GIQ66496.1 DNA-binding response regulator [Paenibacillus cisolokensis]